MTKIAITDAERWMEFGFWLKTHRKAKHLTQTEAANLAGWNNINGKVSWSRYERGEPASRKMVVRLGNALGISEEIALKAAKFPCELDCICLAPVADDDTMENIKFIMTYIGPNYDGLADAVARVAGQQKVNVTKTCVNGCDGESDSFMQLSGDLLCQSPSEARLLLDTRVREGIHRIIDRDPKKRRGPWNFYINIEQPGNNLAGYQVFKFEILTHNQPGELGNFLSVLSEEKLSVMSLMSLLTPPEFPYTKNIGQCKRAVPEGKSHDLHDYTKSLTRRLAKDLRVPLRTVRFKVMPMDVPDVLRALIDSNNRYPTGRRNQAITQFDHSL